MIYSNRVKRFYLMVTTTMSKAMNAKKRCRSTTDCQTDLRTLNSLWNKHIKERKDSRFYVRLVAR
jgi:hypothetical protein